MLRFPQPSPHALPAPQRAAFERIVSGLGKFPRPYASVLASPQVAEQIQALSRQLWQGVLPAAVLEAAFLSVATAQKCQFQWDNHVGKAREAGIGQQSLERIRDGGIPDGPAPLAAALRLVDELQNRKSVRDESFAAVALHFGDQGLAELCAFLGFATTVAFLLNVQQAEDGAKAWSP
jgi:4-carboxymuconolactone decarboxylase